MIKLFLAFSFFCISASASMPQPIEASAQLDMSTKVLWDLLLSPQPKYRGASKIFNQTYKLDPALLSKFGHELFAHEVSSYGRTYFEKYVAAIEDDFKKQKKVLIEGPERILDFATNKQNLLSGLHGVQIQNLWQALNVLVKFYPIYIRPAEPDTLTPPTVMAGERLLTVRDLQEMRIVYKNNQFTDQAKTQPGFAPAWFLVDKDDKYYALIDSFELKKFASLGHKSKFFSHGFEPMSILNSVKKEGNITSRFEYHSHFVALIYFDRMWRHIERLITLTEFQDFDLNKTKEMWSAIRLYKSHTDPRNAIFSVTETNDFFNGIKWWGYAQDRDYWINRDFQALRAQLPKVSNTVLKHGEPLRVSNCLRLLNNSFFNISDS